MSKDIIDNILDEVWFEREFYKCIAGTEDYDVIPYDAKSMSTESDTLTKQALEAHAEKNNLKVLYRISYGNYAVIIDKGDPNRIGIVPETTSDGWHC